MLGCATQALNSAATTSLRSARPSCSRTLIIARWTIFTSRYENSLPYLSSSMANLHRAVSSGSIVGMNFSFYLLGGRGFVAPPFLCRRQLTRSYLLLRRPFVSNCKDAILQHAGRGRTRTPLDV